MYILRVVARKLLHLLSGAVLVARLSGREYPHPDSVMAHPPYGSTQKERIRFALYCAAVILRRFLFQGSEKADLRKAERGGTLCVFT